jgi:hypothetical protein
LANKVARLRPSKVESKKKKGEDEGNTPAAAAVINRFLIGVMISKITAMVVKVDRYRASRKAQGMMRKALTSSLKNVQYVRIKLPQ